ncbi:hypothetical protein COV94_06180 [Candidatus Woesearchaeota archaeon CG11_big_fil_rev_8_21_14_0_20_57_5]|nr:MAG: hypothetical protein COV94_06180 [Candidatus Woesearchaeota archaeon CG11_big_fil_rev_8_21_14_0_20_57_5]
MGTFAGMDATLDYDGNLEKFGAVFGPVLSYAAALGIDVSFENCQMEGWMATGQRDSLCNLAGTYQLRSMMVDAVGGAENLLWIPDPSHGLAQGDGVQGVLRALLMETPSRIRALHIKDTDNNNPEALHVRAMRGGFAPPASQRAHEWDVYGGRPTLIGFGGGGDMDWTEYLRGGATLLARGDGSYKPVIVENEDVWSKQTGNPAATWQANHAAHLNLAPLCYPLTDQGYQFNHTQRQVLQTPSVSEGMLLKTHASVVRAYAGK